MAFELVQARINLPIVELLRSLPDGLEHERFRIPSRRINAEDVQHNVRCGSFITTTDDVAITDDEDQLPFIVVVQCSERVDGTAQRVLALSIARDLAEHEFVQTFGETLCPKLQRSQNYSNMSDFKPLFSYAPPLTFKAHRRHDNAGERQQHVILNLTPSCIPEIDFAPIESVVQASHASSPVRSVHGIQHFVERRRDIHACFLLEHGDEVRWQEVVLRDIELSGRHRVHVVGQIVDDAIVNTPDPTQEE